MTTLHTFSVRRIDGQDTPLSDFEGKAVLVVNVASECGLTPQYEGLQELHARLADRGFAVLGFPCNQFGAQEPGSEEQIKTFCSTKFGVTFPMFEKVEVNGDGAHPLYQWLTAQDAAPEGSGDVAWNFGKFLVGRDGQLLARFAPQTAPEDVALVAAVEGAL